MVLLQLLGGLHSLIRSRAGADIDSSVFKLHYRFTTTILFTFSILVTTATLVGEPIHCLFDDDNRLKDDFVNTYCWIHTTYILPEYWNRTRGIGNSHPHPGIGIDRPNSEKIYHAYYQWVPFILFIQALLFYVPHWLWKTWEDNRLGSLTLDILKPVISVSDKNTHISSIADYLTANINLHNLYAFKFIVCEILNFLNCLLNIQLLDIFLGDNFASLGFDSLRFTEEDQNQRTDPLIVAFPRITKCNFNLYGPSGTVEERDFICLIAINAINEKLFIFLWFWLVFLATVSLLAICYTVVIFCTPALRVRLLQKKSLINDKAKSKVLSEYLNLGDFFLFNQISKNISTPTFSSLIHSVYNQLILANSTDDPEMAASLMNKYPLASDCP